MTNTDLTYCLYLKGSRISGKDIYVSKLDKIFKSNGAESIIDSGYRVNKFEKWHSSSTLHTMLNGELGGFVKGEGAIELFCGLNIRINAFNNTTLITYATL